jgi:WD40 repeat protein
LCRLEHGSPVYSVAFSSDGLKLATAAANRDARIWDVITGVGLKKLNITSPYPQGFMEDYLEHKPESNPVYSIIFSPDCFKVATASGYGTAIIWNASNGAELIRLCTIDPIYMLYPGPIYSIAFSPDGLKLATAYIDDTRIWDAGTGKELKDLHYHPDVIPVVFIPVSFENLYYNSLGASVLFSPDGLKLATASLDHTARIWDVQSGRELQRLEHNDSVNAVAFCPDGTKLATASDDHTARIWNVKGGQEMYRMQHDGWVYSVAFSPDGLKLATASYDNTSRIWDVASGLELQEPKHSNLFLSEYPAACCGWDGQETDLRMIAYSL